MTNTPTLYMLIGVPGAGKSTWLAMQPFDWNTTVVVSSDNYIERVAKSKGQTYNDVFQTARKDAEVHLTSSVREAVKNRNNIVWDQTNVSAKSRKAKLAKIPATYKKIAVVFQTPEGKEHARRLNRPGKTIPDAIMQSMIKSFQLPTKEEGFDEIWYT